MSRTRLCVITAIALAALSAGVMVARHHVLGPEVRVPLGPDTWKVTMLVQGRSGGDAKLFTAMPLEGPRQHVVAEEWAGDDFAGRPQDKPSAGDHRTLRWDQRPGTMAGQFRVRYDCYCSVQAPSAHPGDPTAGRPHVKPQPGAFLRSEAGIEVDDPLVANRARGLTDGLDRPADQANALFRFVEQDVESEPSIAGVSVGAVDCLKHSAGDSAAKARLLAALCRNCGIPARLVTGLTLTKDDEQLPHVWVEAWLRDYWLPMCPFYHHRFGHVPRT